MKTPSSRRKDGFTLVELLVVIAIIAVLAGAGFAAGTAAIQRAKKTTALATCTALESAVNTFHTDYGYMPMAGMEADTPLDTVADLELLKVLLGLPEAATPPLNSRAVKFLSVREGKANKNGIIYNAAGGVLGLYDPWGGPFHVTLDGDYNEQISVTPTGATAVILHGRRVAAWCEGADYAGARKPADDVKTW